MDKLLWYLFNIKIKFRPRSKEKVDHHYSDRLLRKLITGYELTHLEDGIVKMLDSINHKKCNRKIHTLRENV